MKIKKSVFSLLLASAAVVPAAANLPLPLIPAPSHMETGQGFVPLRLPLEARVDNGIDSKTAAWILSATASLSENLPPSAEGLPVDFKFVPGLAEEAYTLTASPTAITITASSRPGFFYGIETLKRLMGSEAMAGIPGPCSEIPEVEISDAPRFPIRSMMLDVSRHFFPAKDIKKLLKLMASYKLNTFQWHLTDDQGWRMPVEGYPLLTTVGATLPANTYIGDHTAQIFWRTKAPMGPFAYTPEEIREIVAFADSLNITIIPEIEMPGHLVAAIAAYPELSCWPDSVHVVRDLHGISRDVLDISNPKAMKFVRDVLDQTMDFFPGKVIHIGGDESPTEAWQSSAGCRHLVDSLGFEGKNEEERFRKLQNWFTASVNDYVGQRGRRLMTWDEIVTAPGADIAVATAINPLVTAYDIVCDNPVEQCAEAKLDCVYSPFGPYYINRRYSDGLIGAGNRKDDPENVYNHPVPIAPNVKGLQATFWTEWVSRMCDLEYLALPRLGIIAEKAWSLPEPTDYTDFAKRFEAEKSWLDAAGYNHR